MQRRSVACVVRDDEAAGSNPVIPTIFILKKEIKLKEKLIDKKVAEIVKDEKVMDRKYLISIPGMKEKIQEGLKVNVVDTVREEDVEW